MIRPSWKQPRTGELEWTRFLRVGANISALCYHRSRSQRIGSSVRGTMGSEAIVVWYKKLGILVCFFVLEWKPRTATKCCSFVVGTGPVRRE